MVRLTKGKQICQKSGGITHTYEFVGTLPYTTFDGREIELNRFRGICAVCGKSFAFKTAKNLKTPFLRTCRHHRRQFQPSRRGAK